MAGVAETMAEYQAFKLRITDGDLEDLFVEWCAGREAREHANRAAEAAIGAGQAIEGGS